MAPESRVDPDVVERLKSAIRYWSFVNRSTDTLDALAERSGLTYRQVQEIHAARQGVLVQQAAQLARALGVRPAWLAFGEEPMVAIGSIGDAPAPARATPPEQTPAVPLPPARRRLRG